MERTYSLIHPDLLTITEGERTWRGADQEWFGDEWQRKAGCAPTAAAMLVSYLAQTRPPCRPLYPSGSWERMDVTALMDELWAHVTPGKKGVNTLHLFTKGFAGFAAQKGVQISLRTLDIPRFKLARPTVDQCAAFLRSALEADSPVAWLNLHSGEAKGLYDWHWVTAIGLEEHSDGPLLCTVLDGGREITADFRLWFRTTKLGGGLVAPAGG